MYSPPAVAVPSPMSAPPKHPRLLKTWVYKLILSEGGLFVPVTPPGVPPACFVAGGHGVVMPLLPLLPVEPVLSVMPLLLGLKDVVLVGGLGGVHVGGVPVGPAAGPAHTSDISLLPYG